MVANCVNAIRTAYQGSNLIKAVGLTAAAGAIGAIKAFDKSPTSVEPSSVSPRSSR